MKTIAVAIDGPSGAGKSTIARAAAGHLGFVYVDTGAMYRTIGLAVCRAGIALGQTERIQSVLDSGIQVSLKYEQGVQHVLLAGEDVSASIRTPEMSKYASFVLQFRQCVLFCCRRSGRWRKRTMSSWTDATSAPSFCRMQRSKFS